MDRYMSGQAFFARNTDALTSIAHLRIFRASFDSPQSHLFPPLSSPFSRQRGGERGGERERRREREEERGQGEWKKVSEEWRSER